MLLILRLLMLLLVSPGAIVVAERASPPILLAFLLMLLVPVKIVNVTEKRIFIWERKFKNVGDLSTLPSRHIAGYKGRDMSERRI